MTVDYPPVPDPVPSESRGWAAAAHLVPLTGIGFIAPLVIWLMKKDEDDFVEYHAREALNFQITLMIAFLGLLLLSAVTGITAALVGPIVVFLGFVPFTVVAIGAVVVEIIAGVKAADGEFYRYPLTLRFVGR